jgi:hypothetical protein
LWWKITDVSELVAASIIALMLEAENTPETSASIYQTARVTTHTTAIFIFTAMRT